MYKMYVVVICSALLACGDADRPQENRDPSIVATADTTTDEVCGTAEPTSEELQQLDQAVAAFSATAAAKSDLTQQVDTVPVYVWVIRNGELGAVSVAQVNGMINLLNSAVDSTQFRFRLVRRTEITNHPEWYRMSGGSAAEKAAKRTLRIGRGDTLNIWTADPGKNSRGTQLTGYAVRSTTIRDGVVIAPWRVLTATAPHETGHWLALRHTFLGGCSEPNDGVRDTPQQRVKGRGCPASLNTCPTPGNDPVTNYMNYGTCRTEFTRGQLDHMELLRRIGRAAVPLFQGDSITVD